MATTKPDITVYLVSHNYGRYLEQAVESVLHQSRADWELIIMDDGSRDQTSEISASYLTKHPDRIRVVTHTDARGLQVTANEALRLARGRYVMRLDADDYLDENALLVLGHYLDEHPDVALVYPNYIYVDEKGNHLGVEHRKSVGDEARLLDQPAHGACTLVRKRVLKQVGGYDESNDRQDGHDLWLKVVNRHKVANVSTPLFYYRQHSQSLSRNEAALLATRARIKRSQVERDKGAVEPRSVAIIGAKNTYSTMPNVVLTELGGRPLIDYTIDQAFAVDGFETILVTTDDPGVVEYCQERYPTICARVRPTELSGVGVPEDAVIAEAVDHLEQLGTYPDIVASLSVHCPLRRSEYIRKAMDTLLLYNADSVISVYEDYERYYMHGRDGLEPLNPAMHRQLRVEREALFVNNGSILVLWRDVLGTSDGSIRKTGHIVMPRWDSFQIKTHQDAWLIEQILKERGHTEEFSPEAWVRKETS